MFQTVLPDIRSKLEAFPACIRKRVTAHFAAELRGRFAGRLSHGR